ncbi:hypothetical protein OC861_006248 [Tilletia horrida]|nr:hypothetical protein OC861_006248 [Tilletia horrida]
MSSDFSTALTAWRDLGLPRIQHDLTAEVEPIVEAQRNGLVSRKALAERTREFRALPEADEDAAKAKLNALKPLLKSYQSEIDALSKRAKAAENSLLSLHTTLAPAPDPYPLLEVILDQTASLTELDSLRASHSRLQRELQSVHLAAERTQNSLTDRIRSLESSLDNRIAEGVQAAEKELAAKYDERLRNAAEREDSLQRSLNSARDQVQELLTTTTTTANEEGKAAAEVTDGSASNIRPTSDAAKTAQIDLLTADLDRAQSRITTLERRNEELRAEVESLRSGKEHEDRIASLSASLSDARTQADSLREALSLERSKTDEATSEHARKADELNRRVETVQRDNEGLREKLGKMADYDEVKRELSIFRSVEFAQYQDDLGDVEPAAADPSLGDNAAAEATGAGGKTLESMLVQKSKKLQDELTSERVAHNELKKEHANVSADLSSARSEVDRLKSLAERLENDLLQLNVQGLSSSTPESRGAVFASDNGTTVSGPEAGGAGTTTSVSNNDPFDLDSLTSPNNTAIPPSSSTTSISSKQPNPESSLLPIITSQRDRFRARNAELEEELRTQFNTISELRAEVKHLQSDNLGLYEKVRYLQSYQNSASNGGDGSYPPALLAAAQQQPRIVVDRNIGRGGAGEDRYRDRYEEHMDPFASFRGREQSRAFAALNPLERLLHMVTRVVLGNRRMRIAFTIYALGLHVLVLLVLFEYELGGGRRRYSAPAIGVTPADAAQAPG